jgi:hypothetical protein
MVRNKKQVAPLDLFSSVFEGEEILLLCCVMLLGDDNFLREKTKERVEGKRRVDCCGISD